MESDGTGGSLTDGDKQTKLDPGSDEFRSTATPLRPRSFMRSWIGRRNAFWPLSFAYAVLAVAFTWPLLLQLGSAVPSDLGDPILNTWILWWNAQHVPFTTTAWDAPAFFPARGVLAFSETLLGLSLFTNPLQWLGSSPQFAYNVAFLSSFFFCAICAALLAHELTGRRDAAFIAGVAFGFHPFRVAHFPQLQVLCSYFMPLGLYALHRYLRDQKWRWLVLFGATWFLQGLTNGYYLLFFSVLVGMWLVYFTPPTVRGLRSGASIAAAWLAAILLMLPVLLTYRDIHALYEFSRTRDEIRGYSADASAFLCTSPRLALWGFLQHCLRPENELFPGVTLPLLIVVGLCVPALAPESSPQAAGDSAGWRSWRSAPVFYFVSALMMWLFSLGPEPTWFGKSLGVHGPYALLMRLPGFHSLRVPARFATLMMLCLAIAGAFAYAKLAIRLGRWRVPVVAALAIGVLADVWIKRMPLPAAPQPLAILAGVSRTPVLELPIGATDLVAMYHSLDHARPVVNGYSGHSPPYYARLQQRLQAHDRAALAALASFGPMDVVLDKARDSDGGLARFLDTAPGLRKRQTTPTHDVYVLAASPSHNDAACSGPALPITRAESEIDPSALKFLNDRDLATRWSAGGQQSTTQDLRVDLGSQHPITCIVLALGRNDMEFPRNLEVSVALDDAVWRQVWRGNTAGEALAASIRDGTRTPIRLVIGEQTGRYIRLRNASQDKVRVWSIAELTVHGPQAQK